MKVEARPVRRSRAEAAQHVRDRLLAAARTVFLRDGFHGASLDAVADEAGFTKGAVYSRFAGKADLFLALLDEHVEARRSRRVAPRPPSGSHGKDASRAMAAWRKQMRSEGDWGLLILEFWCHAARDPQLRDAFAERQRRLRANLAKQVAEQLGDVRGFTADEIAAGLLALGNGMTLELLVDSVADEALEARLAGALVEGAAR